MKILRILMHMKSLRLLGGASHYCGLVIKPDLDKQTYMTSQLHKA